MLITIRIDDNNYVTFNTLLGAAVSNGSDSVPEVTAASISDSKLSDIGLPQLLAITGDVLDYVAAESSPAQNAPSGDWFSNEWLPQCK